MLQDVVNLRRLQLVVDGHYGCKQAPGPEQHKDKPGRVEIEQADPVARLDATCCSTVAALRLAAASSA